MNFRRATLVLCAAALGATSCTRYEPKPLTQTAVNKALAVPDNHALTASTAKLKNPAIKPIAIDLSKPLSPDEIAVLAVVISPDLRAERDAAAVAGAQLIQAGILPNPQLTAGIDFPVGASAPDDHIAYNLGLQWEITSLITRDAKVRAANAELKSVKLNIAWKEWQIAESAKLAAFDLIALQSQLQSARTSEANLRNNVDVLQRAIAQHNKTIADLPAAQSAYHDAHIAVLTLENQIKHQRLALNRAIGLPAENEISLREQSLPSKLDLPTDISQNLDHHRLDLLALRLGYESQDQTLRAAILAQFPKISVGIAAGRDTTNITSVGPAATIDLPLFDHNQGAIATEKANRQKLFDEYVSRVFAARADIAQARDDIESTNRLIRETDRQLAVLKQVVETAEQSLKQGTTDVLSYYAARTALDQKKIDAIKLRQQLGENWIALEIASGRYLPMEEK